MYSYVLAGIVVLVVFGGIFSLWDRFRRDYGIEEWMLKTPDLDGLCADYLDYIKEMNSGMQDLVMIQYFDSQRLVTHNQILEALGLDRIEPAASRRSFGRAFRRVCPRL
jgi:hypothetical protein